MSENEKVLVRVEHLKKYFPLKGGMVFNRKAGAVKAKPLMISLLK